MKEKTIKLRSGREGITRPGHPWIYKSQLKKADPSIKPGAVVSIVDTEDNFMGRGYYNPHSEISVRFLTFENEYIDQAFLTRRISEAFENRKTILSNTDACRVVFSEADGLPGLIVDKYADTLVFQILTLGMHRMREALVEGMRSAVGPAHIFEKSVSPFRKIEGLRDMMGWWGEKGQTDIEIREARVKFLVDIVNGHKTGFYLDQRKSRAALANISAGRRVLDLFSYTGAFAVSAAVFGASDVTAVDIKEEWLGMGRRNAGLNDVADRIEFIKDDAFSFIEKAAAAGDRYDIVIADPPSFIHSKKDIKAASKGYRDLNTGAMKLIGEGGILATFSCSHHMPNERFSEIIKESAKAAGREFAILKRCHQAEDHPIVRGIPETEYLKGYFLRVKGQGSRGKGNENP